MKKMLDFMKSLADDDDASASKTSSEAGALSQASENSDNEDMFKVCALPAEIRTWESTEDLEQNRIARLAAELRSQPLLPPHPDDDTGERDFDDMAAIDAGVRLPYAHCAVKKCKWKWHAGFRAGTTSSGSPKRVSAERVLLTHLKTTHSELFERCCGKHVHKKDEYLDYYEEACKMKLRERMPIVGLSLDRRVLEHLSNAYNDDTIHCYICFLCAEKHVHVGGFDRNGEPSRYKGTIEYHEVRQVMQRIANNDKKWDENFDFDLWVQRYAPDIAVPARKATSTDAGSRPSATATGQAEEHEHGYAPNSWEWKRNINCVKYNETVQTKPALCCPEDVRRNHHKCKHDEHTLCGACEIPLCLECWSRLCNRYDPGFRIPAALPNDNFQGYAHPFIVLNKVRWIEAVTACPLWTAQVTYYVEGLPKERRHLADETLGQQERAYAVRGNVFSYILPWESILRNAMDVNTDAVFESWPHPPHVVAHMIRFLFKDTSEEHCLTYLKELRVRSHVLIGLGKIYIEHLHEDVMHTKAAAVLKDRVAAMARYDANVRARYPEADFGGEDGGVSKEMREAISNAAKRTCTSERTSAFETKNASTDDAAAEDLHSLFDGMRPKSVIEDSNAGKVVDHDLQVSGALGNFSEYRVRLHGELHDGSFAPKYISRTNPYSFNYMSGGPEYPRFFEEGVGERWRRCDSAAVLDPMRYCKHQARRAEMQFASDWTALPIARNLAVRYAALSNAYMMVGRRTAQGRPMADSAKEFIAAAGKLFDRLDQGTCMIHNRKTPINGDVGLLQWAEDLTRVERELLDLYKKTTANLAGSQGIRRQFNAFNTGFRVAYGDVIFVTATPDRRHSALVWRLMRARLNDVGLLAQDGATRWRRQYAGPDTPNLYTPSGAFEQASFEMPLQDLGIPSVQEAIAMSARDPLSTVLHYDVGVRVLLAWLTGIRM